MLTIPPISLEKFQAPNPESRSTRSLIKDIALNLITVGLSNVVEYTTKNRMIEELQIVQSESVKQIHEILAEINQLESEIMNLLRRNQQLQGNGLNLQDQDQGQSLGMNIKELTSKINTLKNRSIKVNYEIESDFSKVAWESLVFIGQWFAQFFTLGIWGIYTDYTLNNRVSRIRAENEYIKDQFEKEKAQKLKDLAIFIDAKCQSIQIDEKVTQIKSTDSTQAAQILKDTENKRLDLLDQLTKLKDALSVAQQQRSFELSGYSIAQEETDRLSQKAKASMADSQLTERRIRDNVNNGENEFAQVQLKVAEKVKQIAETGDAILKVKREKADEVKKLQSELGPIQPKYIPSAGDKAIEGSVGINDQVDTGNWSEYAKRYNNKNAQEVLETGYHYVFNLLLELTKANKIKFINSYETLLEAPSMKCIPCMIVLDLVTGAKLHKPDHQTYQLQINNSGVSMLSSQPINVMRVANNSTTKKSEPQVIRQFTGQDDFTPSIEVLDSMGIVHGVDPVNLKRILNQLTRLEKEYLSNLILSPAIPNDKYEYRATKAFMRQTNHPRVKLLDTAYLLICDQAAAIEKKYSGLFYQLAISSFDRESDEPAFIKEEDHVNNFNEVITEQPIVDWILDEDVISDVEYNGKQKIKRQPEFYQLISRSIETYKLFLQEQLDRLKGGLLLHPATPKTTMTNLTFEDINKQYHVTHQMLGQRAGKNGLEGGHKCLFSNLLAILVTDEKALTDRNGTCLRKAMAAYLEKIMKIKVKWDRIKDQVQADQNLSMEKAEKYKSMKETAELAESFEKEIRYTHDCSFDDYRFWLDPYKKSSVDIDMEKLTPIEIKVAGYTFGVKIALIPVGVPNQPSHGIVDEYGRILPQSSYFLLGPNTKEMLFMTISNNFSYYGLFPKLKENPTLDHLTRYWESIDMHNRKNQENLV